MLKTRDALTPGRTDRLRLLVPPAKLTRPAQSRSLWYALHFPQLEPPELINELASVCQLASADIRISKPDVLALEVRSMLRYFGSFKTLRMRLIPVLLQQLDQLQQPPVFFEAVSPGADTSVLLARTRQQTHITHTEALKSALGKVPVSALPLSAKTLRRLQNCGLIHLRELWRLPSSALRLRFGRELSEYLELLLVQRPSTLERWQPALIFCEDISVETEIANRKDILWLSSQLLHKMEVFLKARQLGTDQVVFSLSLYKQMITHIFLGVRTPTNDKTLWQMLFENRLEQMSLDTSITAVNLRVLHFYPLHASGACPVQKKATSHPGTTLLDLLSSRLGDKQIFRLSCQPSHDPAAAGKYLLVNKAGLADIHTLSFTTPGFGYWKQPPCWLLPTPRTLTVYEEKPVYMTPLEIVHGPQRIESGWWTGHDMRRDYYIALNRHGMMLWIYRDLNYGKQPDQKLAAWFLHGFFA